MELVAPTPDQPHRRFDPLKGEWVLVSAQRTKRPWQGAEQAAPGARAPAYDPDCYLCPRNVRASGERNPDYARTFTFTNDFAALDPDVAGQLHEAHPLLQAHTMPGTCRVICFSPRHDLTLAEMSQQEVEAVVELWTQQLAELAPRYRWVQIFENKGEAMGASNPHPHGQIWASAVLPNEPAREDARQKAYFDEHGEAMLATYARLEDGQGDRVVVGADDWLAVVPYWAVWPFELLVIPRRPVQRLTDLTQPERTSLGHVLRRLLARYDNLFRYSFPYSMGWHGAPGWDEDAPHWQLHAHFFPPLLRSALVRKFMVGYEMLANVQRDLTPEDAAARLRALPDTHHRFTPPDAESRPVAGRT